MLANPPLERPLNANNNNNNNYYYYYYYAKQKAQRTAEAEGKGKRNKFNYFKTDLKVVKFTPLLHART